MVKSCCEGCGCQFTSHLIRLFSLLAEVFGKKGNGSLNLVSTCRGTIPAKYPKYLEDKIIQLLMIDVRNVRNGKFTSNNKTSPIDLEI